MTMKKVQVHSKSATKNCTYTPQHWMPLEKTWNATQRFRDSAETCPDAMYEMGKRYSSGKGITCDGGCAEYWFTRAAERGHDGAKEELYRRAAKKAQQS